jgi:hypothetical protein
VLDAEHISQSGLHPAERRPERVTKAE